VSKEFYDRWVKLYVNALTKLETVEKEEKERLKSEVEMMQIKKKPSMFEQVSIKGLLDMPNNVQKLGNAIIDAGEASHEIEANI
jgi:hypothetical protein